MDGWIDGWMDGSQNFMSSRTLFSYRVLCYRLCRGLTPARVHQGLLDELLSMGAPDATQVWEVVREYVEPVALLRSTVLEWRDRCDTTDALEEVAEDVCLLLGPLLCCDTFKCSQTAARQTEAFPTLEWTPLSVAPFVLTGTPAVFRVDDPPLRELCYPFQQSCQLAAANRQIQWFEASCDVLGASFQASAVQPVRLLASPSAIQALQTAFHWLVLAGFQKSVEGLCSPCD